MPQGNTDQIKLYWPVPMFFIKQHFAVSYYTGRAIMLVGILHLFYLL